MIKTDLDRTKTKLSNLYDIDEAPEARETADIQTETDLDHGDTPGCVRNFSPEVVPDGRRFEMSRGSTFWWIMQPFCTLVAPGEFYSRKHGVNSVLLFIFALIKAVTTTQKV